jgi:hypothetical protein
MTKFEESLKKYLAVFADQEMYFVSDLRNLELFEQTPSNTTADDIRMKISAINDDEIRKLTLMEHMVSHILNLKIDDRLKQGDLTLVEDLAKVPSQGKSYHMLHFASVYCNFHKPDIYPIYSEQHFAFYRQYIKTFSLTLDSQKLDTYQVFSSALNDLLAHAGLKGKMNYLHIRKFGWLYADKVLEEAGIKV